MIVKRFFEPLIAQNSYLIGCAAAGEAIVIDPNRDVQQYVDAAEAANLRITHVTETHIHADFVSGARELAQRTGASLCLSGTGGQDWQYQYEHDRTLNHGDRMTIGNVAIAVLHTPGHTPEHLTFLITDGAVADRPIAAVTGDFVFVSDVGRPDLLEKAAKMAGTMEAGARTLWKSLQQFQQYPDWLQIWPGHGAGSSCGKGISAVPHSTIGYERHFNWAFNAKSETEFVTNVLSGQPDPPPYFAIMKRVNKAGPRINQDLNTPLLNDDRLASVVRDGGLVIDTRAATQFAQGHLPGTLNIPMNGSFVTWAGWLIPEDTEFHLIIEDGAERRIDEVRRALALIGLDRVAGYFAASAVTHAGGSETVDQVSPAELDGLVVIDVRHDNERKEGHIPSSLHIPLGHLAERIAEVPEDTRIVTQCQSGGRSSIAASLLQKMGRKNVANLTGGYRAWNETVRS